MLGTNTLILQYRPPKKTQLASSASRKANVLDPTSNLFLSNIRSLFESWDVRGVYGSNHTTTSPHIQEKQLTYCQTVCVSKAKCLSGLAARENGIAARPGKFLLSFDIFLF
jgi:hypothetical protein